MCADSGGSKPFKPKSPDLSYKGPDWRKGGNPKKGSDWSGHGDWRYGGGKWNNDKYKDKK